MKGAILTNPEIRGFDKGYPVMSSAIGDQDKSSWLTRKKGIQILGDPIMDHCLIEIWFQDNSFNRQVGFNKWTHAWLMFHS